MVQLKLFIELTRLKKPIGYMLLFWPCAWGLTIAYDFSREINTYLFYLFLFFSGSILMRSAGCIVNDIVDRNYDKKVFRTKNRPIASGKVSVQAAMICSLILCLVAFIVLIQFNNLTIILALGSMPLAFTYPLMKRFTYWPQLFLGITFNYGLILGWTAIQDEIIGVKSTSIKFKKKPKLFLTTCYLIFIISLILVGIYMKLNTMFYFFILIPTTHLFFYQIHNFNFKDPKNCLRS